MWCYGCHVLVFGDFWWRLVISLVGDIPGAWLNVTGVCHAVMAVCISTLSMCTYIHSTSIIHCSVSQTVVRGPQVVLGFCSCGPLGLNISQKKKKDRKNKINVNCVSHAIVENLKQFAFKGDNSRVDRRTFWLVKVAPTLRKFEKRWSTVFITNVIDV
jgi:hypothetical protein